MTVNRTQIEENQVQGNTFLQVGNNLSDVASQQTALNNITGISGNTNGYVLTNDSNTGNAVFMPPAYVAGDGGVATDTTLAGDGSSGNPLGIAEIITDTTLTGYGTINNPLGIPPLEARRYVADPESIGGGGVGIGEADPESIGVGGVGIGEAVFQNGWHNFNNNTELAQAAFYKDTFGIIHLEGVVNGGNANQVIFTLPAGYTPTTPTRILSAISNDSVCDLRIDSSGNIITTSNNGAGMWVSLDGISFRP